jgi:hypothetical protein
VLLVAIHQVEIELGDAQAGKFGEFVSMRRGGANYAEAVDDFVRDEIAAAAVDFAVGAGNRSRNIERRTKTSLPSAGKE